jgi:hypothetical protein
MLTTEQKQRLVQASSHKFKEDRNGMSDIEVEMVTARIDKVVEELKRETPAAFK